MRLFSPQFAPGFALVGLFIGLMAVTGCVETRVTYDHWGLFAKQYGDGPPSKGSKQNRSRRAADEGWAILLESFEGSNRFRRANDLVRRLGLDQRIDGLWMQESGGGKANVYRGRYPNIADPRALADLDEVRNLSVDELKPYEDVEFVSLGGDGQGGNMNPLDLRAFTGYYTLQIGFYDSEFGSEFRDAAERAAKALRKDGEQAYFYHGVHRSMLTVGLFTDEDFERDGPVHVYGPRILTLQEKYPDNLANGRQLLVTARDGGVVEQRAQESSLVRVP